MFTRYLASGAIILISLSTAADAATLSQALATARLSVVAPASSLVLTFGAPTSTVSDPVIPNDGNAAAASALVEQQAGQSGAEQQLSASATAQSTAPQGSASAAADASNTLQVTNSSNVEVGFTLSFAYQVGAASNGDNPAYDSGASLSRAYLTDLGVNTLLFEVTGVFGSAVKLEDGVIEPISFTLAGGQSANFQFGVQAQAFAATAKQDVAPVPAPQSAYLLIAALIGAATMRRSRGC